MFQELSVFSQLGEGLCCPKEAGPEMAVSHSDNVRMLGFEGWHEFFYVMPVRLGTTA